MAKELTVVKSWPSADTETSPAPDTLDLISQYESGNRNVPNYRFDPGHTAQGYYQITNTNWNNIAPLVGIDTSTYPSAMSAPKDAQAKVATYLLTQTPAGIRNWTDYNPRLQAALGTAPGPQGTASRSADTAPMPAAADSGSTDLMSRIARGESVQVTPEDILRTAFGPTGVQIARTPAPQPQAEAPVTVVKSWEPPPPTPPQSIGDQLKNQGFLDSAWSAIKGSLSTIKDVFTGEYSRQTAEQIKRFHELEKNGTPEQKREFAKQVVFSNIPFASTVYKATQGNLPGAAGDIAGMAALPVAMEAVPAAVGGIKTGLGAAADVARSPVAADVVGVVSPRAANVLRIFRRGANAVESVQEAMAAAKAKAAAAGTPAAEAPAATPAAAPAVAKTPGQAYAESQGHDWAKLSANDRQLMEQIAQAQANVAAQPPPTPPAAPALTSNDLASALTGGKSPSKLTVAERANAQSVYDITKGLSPEDQPPPVTPPVAPAAPQTAPEAPAATPEPSVPPVEPSAPQTLQPVEQVFQNQKARIQEGMTPGESPASGPLAANPRAAAFARQLEEMTRVERIGNFLKRNFSAEDLDKFGPKDWELIGQGAGGRAPTAEQIAEVKANLAPVPAEVAKMPPARAEAAVASKLKRGQTPAEALAEMLPESAGPPPAAGPAGPTASEVRVEALARHFAKDTEITSEAIRSIAGNSDAARLLTKLSDSLGIKGRPAPGEIEKIANRVGELRQAQTPAAPPEAATIPTEGIETPAQAKAAFETEQAKPAPAKRTRRAKR